MSRLMLFSFCTYALHLACVAECFVCVKVNGIKSTNVNIRGFYAFLLPLPRTEPALPLQSILRDTTLVVFYWLLPCFVAIYATFNYDTVY